MTRDVTVIINNTTSADDLYKSFRKYSTLSIEFSPLPIIISSYCSPKSDPITSLFNGKIISVKKKGEKGGGGGHIGKLL